MAYVDKITTLRRMALIYPGHNISWEGVNIEGDCLLKEVGAYGSVIMQLTEEEVERYAEGAGYELKYQDPKGEESWEPREATTTSGEVQSNVGGE